LIQDASQVNEAYSKFINMFYKFRCIWENRIINVLVVEEEDGVLQLKS
jgi:hypothetical protein